VPHAIRLLEGDNNQILCDLANAGESFTLAYMDPPFFAGREFRTPVGEFAFDDRWPSRAAYLEELRIRAQLAWSMLIPEGSLVVHLDPTVVHYAKVMLDAEIGECNFAGEIVWRYRRLASKTPNFQSMHDVMLRYVRDHKVKPRFNTLQEPLAPSTLETWGTGRQHAVKNAEGRRVRSMTTDEPAFVPLSDVWEISRFAPSSHENTDYPTQKPEALYERLVDALTNEGEAVLDPYMGSGTMPAVCAKRGRRCVSIDKGPLALRTARARLAPILAQGNLFEKA